MRDTINISLIAILLLFSFSLNATLAAPPTPSSPASASKLRDHNSPVATPAAPQTKPSAGMSSAPPAVFNKPSTQTKSAKQSTAAQSKVASPIKSKSLSSSKVTAPPSKLAPSGPTAKTVPAKTAVLQGYVRHHRKHPMRSFLKEEFDGPIHEVTTDNKDF